MLDSVHILLIKIVCKRQTNTLAYYTNHQLRYETFYYKWLRGNILKKWVALTANMLT
jgi:hypothetical protein